MNNIKLTLIAIIICVPIILTEAFINKVIKPKIYKHKIKINKLTIEELSLDYENAYTKITSGRFSKYAAIISFCTISDIINLNATNDTILQGSQNMITITILSVTLGIVLNQAPSAIADYIFAKGKQLTKLQERIIAIFIIISTVTIISLIIMLFILRFYSMNLLYDESLSVNVMRSMSVLWSSLAIGTSITSFLYSSINKTVIIPNKLRRLKRKYNRYAEMLRAAVKAELEEIEGIIKQNEKCLAITREYEDKVKYIIKYYNLMRESYKIDKTTVNSETNDKVIPIDRFLKTDNDVNNKVNS